jgi:hypothetical protein
VTVFADSFADDLARRGASIVLESLPASDPSPWLSVDRAADYLDTGNPGARRVALRRELVRRRSHGRGLGRSRRRAWSRQTLV